MATVPFHIIIPARFASQRLPGKAMKQIDGKPLVAHVHDRAMDCGAESVTVATDDERIQAYCRLHGMDCLMTSPSHPSGTDRIAECIDLLSLRDDDCVVNLQGDEPLTPVSAVHAVASLLDDQRASMSTLAIPITEQVQIRDPNCVKVVIDQEGFALYFSRAPIPFDRDGLHITAQSSETVTADPAAKECPSLALRHVGLYGYRAATVRAFADLPPAQLETLEKLEQLRMLYHGYRIKVMVLQDSFPAGVDTEEDLKRVDELIANRKQ